MIKVIVENNQWEILWEFNWEEWLAFTEMAAKNWVEIPVSCWSWACGICRTTIVEWSEYIDREMTGIAALPVWEDEILSCIAGVKWELFDEEQKWDITITIKRLY